MTSRANDALSVRILFVDVAFRARNLEVGACGRRRRGSRGCRRGGLHDGGVAAAINGRRMERDVEPNVSIEADAVGFGCVAVSRYDDSVLRCIFGIGPWNGLFPTLLPSTVTLAFAGDRPSRRRRSLRGAGSSRQEEFRPSSSTQRPPVLAAASGERDDQDDDPREGNDARPRDERDLRFGERNAGTSMGTDVLVPVIVGGGVDGEIGAHDPLAFGRSPGGRLVGPVSVGSSGSLATADASAALRAGRASWRSMSARMLLRSSANASDTSLPMSLSVARSPSASRALRSREHFEGRANVSRIELHGAIANRSPAVRPLISLPGAWALYLFGAWAVIAAIALLRVGVGFFELRRLRRGCRTIDKANPDWHATVARLCPARRVEILTSDLIHVPTAIGFIRPAIVIPASLLAQLSRQNWTRYCCMSLPTCGAGTIGPMWSRSS